MKKILIFSNGEKIGDGVIKLALIKAIFQYFKNYHITWLANGTTVYASSLKNISSQYLNKVIYNAKLNLLPWNKISKIYSFESDYYDIIIDTQKTVYRTIALKRIKSKTFVSSTALWLFSDVKPNKKLISKKYYLDNLFDMLNLLANKQIKRIDNYSCPRKLEIELHEIFKNKNACIGLAPGAGEKNKKWKIENFLKVAKYFSNKGYAIAFFIGPEDILEKKIILKAFPEAFFPEDLIANFTGPEVVMASTKFLLCSVSNDSGVSHMLSTNLSPLLKLFGPKDPIKFTPESSMIKTISAKEYGSDNINSIPIEKVIESIKKLI